MPRDVRPPDAGDLVSLLRRRAAEGAAGGFSFLESDGSEVALGWADLDARARAVGAALHGRGLAGQPVLVLHSTGPDYVASIFGCLYAGAIAVAAAPPDPTRLQRWLPRLRAVLAGSRARCALTSEAVESMAGLLAEQEPAARGLTWLASDTLSSTAASGWLPAASDASTPAFLHVAGTGRGVLVTHGDLLASARLVGETFGHSAASSIVSWMAPHGDIGLVAGVIEPLRLGCPAALLSPHEVLRRPISWLELVSRHRATTSAGTSFAFDLCARRVSPEERAGLDLSRWRVVFGDAEPIDQETVGRFATAFAGCGFRARHFYACAGAGAARVLPRPTRLAMEVEGGAARPADATAARGPARRVSRADDLEPGAVPLTPSQAGLWFLHRYSPDTSEYNIATAFVIRSRLDVAAFRRSLQILQERHGGLRIAFGSRDGLPHFRVLPEAELPLTCEDASTWDDATCQRRLDEEAHRPFDLEAGPPRRCFLFSRTEQEHLFLLVMHHLLADLGTFAALADELSQLYEGLSRARPAPDLPPAPDLRDYVRWQADMLAGEGERLWAFWKKQLAGPIPVLELSSGRHRPAALPHPGGSHAFSLSREVTEALRDLARREGTTLYTVLLSVLQTLLHRYTGQEDIWIGSPMSCRTRPQLARLVGYLVNPVILRGDLSGDPTFSDLLARNWPVVLDALAHQEFPFPWLIERLQPSRDPGRPPLHQVMFVLQQSPAREGMATFAVGEAGARMELGGLQLESLPLEHRHAQFDLTVTFAEQDGVLRGSLKYSRAIFDADSIRAVAAHFGRLAEAAAADPRRRLRALPLLSRDEAAALTEPSLAWPTTGGEVALHRRFEARASEAPDAEAVSCGTERMTYAELDALASALARHLVSLGVGRGDRVGLFLDRSIDAVVAILAIVKAGAAYVPIDPAHPDERARFMLADCEARALVTDAARAGAMAGAAPVVVDVGDWQLIARHQRGRLDVEVTGDDLAYVIYTSGSTGAPKGVAVTHANVARLFDATSHWFAFDASDVWTLFHSLAFDFSVWELWGALLHGGRLVVVPYLVSRSPEAFLDLLDGERVTVLNQTPSAFRQLIHAEGETGARDLALRHVIFGGEALAFASLAPWFERHGDRTPRLVNMYGITETTVHVTYRPITIEDTRGPASCIGQPIPDLSLYILDGDLQPVPTGVAGELVVGGAGVAKGYVNRPELTRERFIPDPHRPGGRLYRSGDLARRLPDGDIEYLGRIDDQVKIRGFRIELGEIESALAAHPGVREAAVLAVGDAAEKRLAAYVVARDPGSAGAGELQAFLAERLPAYMVPAAWMFLPALPVTGNGKVDRRALPVPDDARPDLQAAFAAPRSRAERALAQTWSEVLRRDQVGLDDNFFHLGGDSIRGLQVVARARRRGLELTIQQLFTHQTVRALAEQLGQADEVVPTNPPFSLLSEADRARLPEGAVDAYPLSTLLSGLLFHAEYGADYEAYLTAPLIRGSFRADALERALAGLVERHPILRSAFDLYSFSEPLHIVYAGVVIPVEVHDLRGDPDPEAVFDAWLLARRRVRPSWMSAPLARVHVHLLSPDTFRLTLYEPFLDGWSASALWSELLRLYLAASAGRLEAAPPPAISYGDFVALERRTAASAESRAFWARQLDGVEPLRMPRWPGGGARARHAEYLFDIPRDTFDGVKRLVRQAGLPLKAALVAAHVRVVALLSGRRDVVTGCLQNGRPEAEGGDEVLGMFLNTVPIRQRLPGGTWLDLVRSVFEAEKACLPHRRYPLALLQKDLNGGQPFFDTACNFTQFHLLDHLKELDGVEVLDIRATDQTYFFWTTTYNVDADGSHLRVVLDGNGPTAEQMDAIRGHYLAVLAAMARDPAGRYDDDAALLAGEQRLIAGWNRTDSDFPDQAALHQLFEAQVVAAPSAIAARAGEQALTYRDLNALANRMAHFLVEEGVGPEEIVPISARRGLDLLAAMVAVNKAGGAFLPVDPHSPPQRLARTIAACGARLFIADGAQRAAAEQALAEIDVERRPRLVDLDELGRIARPSHDLPARGGPKSLAYVMFTSGSTGVPKGAMVEQRGMINHLFAKNRDLGFGPGDVLGQTAAQSFDIFVYQNLAPLVAGGRVQIVADDEVLAAELLLDEVRAHGITVLNIVPSQLRALVSEAARSPAGAAALASLRWMVPTGEPLPPELCREWFELAPDRPLLNAYGHTECSDDQAHHPMTAAPAGETTPIGRPIQNLHFHVLGGDLRPMPIGVPGELYIGGVGVGRGYLGDPARTAEKFVPDPFTPAPGARLYKTGDLGRWLPGGLLDVLGRSDFMVKIRGHRVELGEIEAALARHPSVREAVATVREDTSGRKQLVAYLVGRQPLDPAELRAAMRAELPEHMVPSAFVSLDELPLNRNGKVDRKALPAPRQDSRPLEPPRGATEELLAGIFAQVLSAPALDRDDGFFELGGDSLLATQVIARVRAAFAVRLGVRDLFETPSIAGFALRIDAARGQLADGEAALTRDPAGQPVASFAQRRLWFLAQLDPTSASYNIPVALRIEGELDRSALEQSWAELVRRHAALRTTFADQDGEPVPLVMPASSIACSGDAPIAVDDLSGLAVDERERECRRRLAEEAARPFDLAAGPLARMRLVRLGDAEHVLSLVAHHIISDGWSAAVLVREMAALYQARARGAALELPELAVDYTDYAAWQRTALFGGALAREVEHWRRALDGAPAKLELPTDHPRPPVQGLRGASVPVHLPAELAAAIRTLARRENVTPFMVVLAGFQVLLARLADQEDISVGAPVAGRTRQELEGLVGFFVNTLVLRTRLDGNPSFAEVLRRVREVTLGAYAHQSVPFEKLVEELRPERDLSRTPLFQVMLAWQVAPLPELSLGGLHVRPVDVETSTSKFELTLSLSDTGGAIEGALEYDIDLFERSTAEAMVRRLVGLFEAAARDPAGRIRELPLLDADERREQLATWNDTDGPAPLDTCFHRLFEAAVERTPDAIAVRADGRRTSFAELNRWANRWARTLATAGVGPDAVVGILDRRGDRFLAAMLAAFKAGGAYMPLDPDHPPARWAEMVGQAGPHLLLVAGDLRERAGAALQSIAPERRPRLVSLEDLPSAGDESNLASRASAENLAYVLFTSGSTGAPKGVLIEQRGMVNHLFANIAALGLGPADTVAQTASVCFDISVWQFLVSLLTGGQVVIVPDDAARDPRLLVELLEAEAITVFEPVPAVLAALLDECERIEPTPALSSVRWVMPTGEALPDELCRRWFARYPSIPLINAYGPAECSDDVTFHVLDRPPASTPPIGRPVLNMKVYVLDRHQELLPVGVPGEIWIGGVGVGRGYAGAPGLTAERFLPSPFASGERLYRTGDLGRLRTDGSIDYLGRADTQVKVRGHRIELGEVESALARHPGVREAAAAVRPDRRGQPSLVGYIVGRAGPESADGDGRAGPAPRPADLRAFLREALPDYMVPSIFVALPALPRSANGKVERDALPAPIIDPIERIDEPPRSPVEETIAGTWREVLGLDRVGIRDNFFELGGHSLLATQVTSRLRRSVGVDLPVRTVFEAPTVAELAARVDQALAVLSASGSIAGTASRSIAGSASGWTTGSASGSIAGSASGSTTGSPAVEAVPLLPVSRRGPLPLSVAQTRLWFLEQLQPGTPLYNLPAAIRLRGRLDVSSLERALSELVRRHEALRTTFPVRGDEPVQLIAPARPLPLPCVDLSGLPDAARMAEVERRAVEEANTPFDLSVGPMVRACLLRLAEGDHVLLLTMHHIVSDEWSRGVLLREIGALYLSFAGGRPAPLPDLPIQYGDYAVWQRARLTDDVLAAQIAYWREQLRGAPAALDLPTDFARPPVQSYRGATIRFHIPRDAAESMRRFCLAAGVTPFMALLAAFQVLMARYSGQDDISVGSATAGRSRPELEGLIGFFVNTLVLRARVSRELSFRDLIAQVKEVTLGAYAHDELPFDRLVEELNPKRTLGRSPLFQVGLTLQNAPMPDVALPGLEVAPLGIETSTAKFDLLMALEETGGGIRGSIAYAADLFERATVVRLTEHYVQLLRDAVTRPDTRVGQLAMLTEDERRDLVRDRNRTRVVRAGERCVHELVEEQAAARPGAIAVEFGAERLTYAELDRRASSIAELLASRGVGPEVRVGVALGRSADLVAVLLGVLKAGGAYVPLDPEHPEARLAAMLEDARPALVVAATSLPAGLSPAALVSLDELREVMRRDPTAPVARRAAPGNLAYVCFTSGSTGRPKGVAVEHRSVVNLVRGTADVRLGPAQTSLLAARLTFDLAAFEIWSCLASGGRLVVHPGRSAGDTDELGAVLSRHRVTSLFLTAGHLAHVVDARPEILRGLDQLLTGGDVASAPHVRRVVEELGVPVVNCYGPTEATVLCASHRMTGDVGSTVPIGRPIDNTQIYVLDADLQLVPAGHPGELYVGGDGLARGYVGLAAATAERFVPDPFGPPGARLYRTGDLVRHGRSGALEFLGRSDGQVKVRGFRVEPGEVEAALLALPAVEQAVVVARPDPAVGRQLVAYVVTSDRAVDPAWLRAALAERLPDYMVPSRFAALDALPLTANGKVDRDALPDPDEVRPRDASLAPPRTQLERDLVAIWEELLGLSPVGIHDVFFELGGHSLLTVRLADLIQERLGVTVQVAALFEATTVEQLAAWIAQERAPALERPLVEIEPGGAGTPLFCFHPVGGQVFAYAELARRIARSRPVYGLESAWEGGSDIDLPAAAARYVAAMRSVQPRGPYFLAGWSSGGAVAFEVACQLEAGGEAAVLALLDAWSPEQMSSWLPRPEVLQLSSDLLHRGQVPRPVLDQIGQMARVVGAWADGLDPTSLAPRFDTFRANVEALRTYTPGRFGGPVLEIQAPDEAGPVNLHGRAGRSRGWRELCQRPPEVAPVRGGHETMLQEPFVAAVAELLEERAALLDEPALVANPPPRAEQG